MHSPRSAAALNGRRAARALLLAAIVAAPSLATAHKLQVFASVVDRRIEGSAYFAGGRKAIAATKITIQDTQGETLEELSPGSDGHFSYLAQKAMDHVVIATTGDGHRAEWRVSADELAPAFGKAVEDSLEPGMTEHAKSVQTAAVAASSALDPTLTAAIEQSVARQIRPLREQMAAAESTASLRDILGGIGYIIGLAGIAAWLHGRASDKRS